MQHENIYWSCDMFGSEDSMPNHQNSREYIDPWDLENYAYIRDQLDSVEVSSQPSSAGESLDSHSHQYYHHSPRVGRPMPLPHPPMDSMMTSEPCTGSYAAIEELAYGALPIERNRRRSEYDFKSQSYEADMDTYYIYGRNTITVPTDRVRERRQSFSCVDYVSYEPEQKYGNSKRERYLPERSHVGPIYDDIESNMYRPNLGMSKYGHLQIDYSCNWSNLDKYICH